MGMRRYLLVLDMDLLAVDSELDLEPINHLVALQEHGPCEVVVMSLIRSRQARLPAMELVLGARSGKFPVAPQPDHDITAAAEHRMNLAIRHLKTIGCQASGLLSDEDDLVKAVRSETRRHDYDEVILATGRQGGSSLARVLRRDPIHQLRRRLGARLIVFRPGPGVPHRTLPA
jgi:chemotaxis response regulator CheB